MKILIALLITLVVSAASLAQTTEFTYQGRLTDGTVPANGTYPMQFDLFAAPTGGTPVATDSESVSVINGIFTVILDFGAAAFDGNARWLEITVNTTMLTPRQPITSAPYAIKSSQAGNALNLNGVAASQYVLTTDSRLSDERAASSVNFGTATLTGVVPIINGGTGSSTQNFVDLSTTQTIAGAKTFSNSSNSFTGDGTGLTNINPANISSGTANIDVNGRAANAAMAISGAAPSVTSLTLLALNYSSMTTISDLTGGVNGQCVVLLTLNNNVALGDAGNFRLSASWNPFADDTLTVCRSNAGGSPLWYERARSVNATPLFVLTVAKSGSGSGTVTSFPAGINCGATCQATYSGGTIVQLTATPSGGSTFAGWSGGGCTGTGTCQVTMDSAKNVTANFNFTIFLLEVFKSGPGSGTVTSNPAGINCGGDCSQNYNSGTFVTLTATPSAPFSTFAGWTGAGCTGTGTCQVTMDSAKNVTATFNGF